MKTPNVLSKFFSLFKAKRKNDKESKSVSAMSDLLIAMNHNPNDYDFGAEARVIVQKFAEDLDN